jgi:predicted Zn-ribbon and HTH transcriptional regulator
VLHGMYVSRTRPRLLTCDYCDARYEDGRAGMERADARKLGWEIVGNSVRPDRCPECVSKASREDSNA